MRRYRPNISLEDYGPLNSYTINNDVCPAEKVLVIADEFQKQQAALRAKQVSDKKIPSSISKEDTDTTEDPLVSMEKRESFDDVWEHTINTLKQIHYEAEHSGETSGYVTTTGIVDNLHYANWMPDQHTTSIVVIDMAKVSVKMMGSYAHKAIEDMSKNFKLFKGLKSFGKDRFYKSFNEMLSHWSDPRSLLSAEDFDEPVPGRHQIFVDGDGRYAGTDPVAKAFADKYWKNAPMGAAGTNLLTFIKPNVDRLTALSRKDMMETSKKLIEIMQSINIHNVPDPRDLANDIGSRIDTEYYEVEHALSIAIKMAVDHFKSKNHELVLAKRMMNVSVHLAMISGITICNQLIRVINAYMAYAAHSLNTAQRLSNEDIGNDGLIPFSVVTEGSESAIRSVEPSLPVEERGVDQVASESHTDDVFTVRVGDRNISVSGDSVKS